MFFKIDCHTDLDYLSNVLVFLVKIYSDLKITIIKHKIQENEVENLKDWIIVEDNNFLQFFNQISFVIHLVYLLNKMNITDSIKIVLINHLINLYIDLILNVFINLFVIRVVYNSVVNINKVIYNENISVNVIILHKDVSLWTIEISVVFIMYLLSSYFTDFLFTYILTNIQENSLLSVLTINEMNDTVILDVITVLNIDI